MFRAVNKIPDVALSRLVVFMYYLCRRALPQM